MRVDAPFPAESPARPDRSSCILEHGRVAIARAKPVLKHERRHSQRVEPLGDLPAFMIAGQHSVTAAGTDNNRGARGRSRLREPDRQGRNIVLRIIALGPGRSSRPEGDHLVVGHRLRPFDRSHPSAEYPQSQNRNDDPQPRPTLC
jgi:hypothetical protein